MASRRSHGSYRLMLSAGCRKITVTRARGNYLDGFNPPSDVHPGAQTSTFARLSAPSRVV
eukprot:1383064-Prymnesium_polylepis.1